MLYPLLMLAGFTGLIVMGLLGVMHAPGLHRHGHALPGHGHAPGPHAPGAHAAPVHAAPVHAAPVHAAHAAPAHAAHAAPAHAAHAAPGHGLPAHAAPALHGPAAHDPTTHIADHSAAHDLTGARLATLDRGFVWLAPLLSPLSWFSWLFGGGAGGTIATALGAGELVAIPAAIGGALAFQWGVVRPIWTLIFRFESKPAGNLDSCLFMEVEAVSAFSARGEGLVRVVVDGRTEDILARLVATDGPPAGRVRRGDRLVIQEIDPRTSACLVTRA